mmetsp:Transcript_11213/g.27898  ORF Transcript_11213/g.27898 Transcript_11213/m.27898 type:complete len:259 (-) Transcript_11213:1127-1903(-)
MSMSPYFTSPYAAEQPCTSHTSLHVNVAHSASNKYAIAFLEEGRDLCAHLLLEDGTGLLWLRPMGAIAAWRGECTGVQINALAREFAAKLRIFVVEILHSIPEAIAVPIDHYHVAMNARQELHLLVDILAHLRRHNADGVAHADGNFRPILIHPSRRKLILQQCVELLRVANNVPHAFLMLLWHILPAKLYEVGVKVDTASVARTIHQGQERLTCSTADFNNERSSFRTSAKFIAELADEVRGVNKKILEEALGRVHC